MSRPGTGISDPLCATQFSCSVCARRHLVVAREAQLAIDDVEDRVGAPVGRSVARQRGRVPPPHSSVKITFVPSLLNVAECQYAKFWSAAWSSRDGCTGSEMSSRIPFPAQAPAASPASGNTVMSWHRSCQRLLRTGPVIAPATEPGDRAAGGIAQKWRSGSRCAPVCGAASGTSMTSMLKSAVWDPRRPADPSSPRAPSRADGVPVPDT